VETLPYQYIGNEIAHQPFVFFFFFGRDRSRMVKTKTGVMLLGQAWFRELPRGVLDSLSPEKVMQCNSEGEAVALVKTLPPMQGALLDWGINLMADVVQEERFNKMNAHNIAMVFAPNMTQVCNIHVYIHLRYAS
jgi:hypothetical protein